MKTILLAATFFCFVNLINGQAGRLDPSFGNHGIVKTDLGKSYPYSSSGSYVLADPNGSIFLIVQTGTSNLAQSFITKRHPDGSIDSSYGLKGFSANVKMAPSTAILQPDGKIVVAGSVDGDFNNYTLVLARFNVDGSIDSSFSDDGTQMDFNFSSVESLSKIEVYLYNGKIIVSSGFYVSRYNGDGSLDSTFNGGRITSLDSGMEFFEVEIEGLAVQSDGKIVIAGNIHLNLGDSSVYVLARYKTNGSLDSTFGDNGTVITHLNSINNLANSVVIQNNGKILVGGGSLVQYNSNGSVDSSFSGDGVVVTDFSPDYYMPHDYSLNLEPGGKIVISGNTGKGSISNYIVARYNTDGSIDNTFGEDGKVSSLFKTASTAILKNGKIIVAGFVNADFALAGYTANGTFDDTFGNGGNLTGNIQSGYTIYKTSAIQKDGKIVVAGRTWNGSNFDFVVARYNANGTLDNAFGANGAQTIDFASKDDYANSVVIQSDGKIVVVGYSGKRFDSSLFSMARYNTDGSLDNTFSDDGKSQINFGSVGNIAYSAAIQSDGKILAAGNFGVARFNTDGHIDNTFDEDGKQTMVFSPVEYTDDFATPYSIAIQSDGKIVAGGRYIDSYAHISVARLNTDGSRDSTFTQYNRGENGDIFVSVAIQNDGKIVVGGYSYYRGFNSNYIVRLNTAGTQEVSRSTDLEENQYFPFVDFGNLVAIQSDGKMIVSGTAITRYNTDGNLDSSFGANGIEIKNVTGSNIYINSILISGDKLYGVGSGKAPGNVGLIARYLLDNNSDTPPTVSLTAPSDNAIYLAPVNLQLAATAADADGTITKVEFYSGDNLLYTDSISPYNFIWKSTPAGNYTLTAKATDNSGLTTVSAPVHISVVSNKAPVVTITNPVNNRTFAAPAYIHFEAAASDVDGRIIRVEFYSGSTLLKTEYKAPYKYVWKNLPVGIYTVTAIATDNFGAQTTSAPVTIKVKEFNPSIVSSKLIAETNDLDTKTEISLKAWPNPASKVVTISTNRLQQNKLTTISILSATGVVLKTIRVSNSTTQLDVSSLTSGVYTIKFLCGDKVLYKQFVKL